MQRTCLCGIPQSEGGINVSLGQDDSPADSSVRDTGRPGASPWLAIRVVPAGTPEQAKAALGEAMRLLARRFQPWRASRQDIAGQSPHPP